MGRNMTVGYSYKEKGVTKGICGIFPLGVEGVTEYDFSSLRESVTCSVQQTTVLETNTASTNIPARAVSVPCPTACPSQSVLIVL